MTEEEARGICLEVLHGGRIPKWTEEAVLKEVTRRCEQDRTVREAFVIVGLAAINVK
ncbi:hypothetical protein LMG28138_01826 [Pararobbsia alpina]|uniref:Uncharacterized protein n=1 Tax=Pararobbsia alpina TaxID=621374 RepID=A0A6S7B1C7_9BURK|nr:hypothetical protein LMG28138_01826 [Pararobbsia alpina]